MLLFFSVYFSCCVSIRALQFLVVIQWCIEGHFDMILLSDGQVQTRQASLGKVRVPNLECCSNLPLLELSVLALLHLQLLAIIH